MSKLTLSLACGNYERTAAIFDGRVPVEGIDLIHLRLHPSEIFWRQIKHAEFDVSEMSLSAFIMSIAANDNSLVGIPVFPSRVFRHSSIFVSEESELSHPSDLRGARIGLPEYHMTAALFARGLLSDEYDVAPSDVTWVQAGLDAPGRIERVELHLPKEIRLEVEPRSTLTELLAAREIDAFVTPRVPRNANGIRRLFRDARASEKDYYARTGIFPIMHVLTLTKELHERFPWVAKELMRAFTKAKEIAEREARVDGALTSLLPWYRNELEAVVSSMGEDFWPYGVAGNQSTLDAACRYSHEQGLSKRLVSTHELFSGVHTEEAVI